MMLTANHFADLSYCKRKKVGAVLSDDSRIVATGFNGTIPGQPNICELDDGTTSELVLHAEQNVLTFCNREGIKTNGCTMFITLSPCKTCAKLMASAGINEVIYEEEYRDTSGIDFLKSIGIKVNKHESSI